MNSKPIDARVGIFAVVAVHLQGDRGVLHPARGWHGATTAGTGGSVELRVWLTRYGDETAKSLGGGDPPIAESD